MDKMKILILGSTGMLGSMVLKYLSTKKLNIVAPSRKDKVCYGDYDYIINCIGIIKQKLTDPEEAILINSILPYKLAQEAPNAKIIQIATDCVYSGEKGCYTEEDVHDAHDIYGKTKSLGEVKAKNFYNIRTSIIGPEPKGNVSLFGWFMSQKKKAFVDGYTNHLWNGITTLHFAVLCYAIIKKKRKLPNLIHFTPADIVSKYELLKILAEKFNRKDITIGCFRANTKVNRSLSTIHKRICLNLWRDMGYKHPPTIERMVEELAHYVHT
jgi:dTDP-4-dehydrorhamnose reductase